MSTPYFYPPTRWQNMAETGEAVDETLDIFAELTKMTQMLASEWSYLCRVNYGAAHALKSQYRKHRNDFASAILEIVNVADYHRYTEMAAHLSGDERERAIELLSLHSATALGKYPNEWDVLAADHPSRSAASLCSALAADRITCHFVTRQLIEADEAVRALLGVIERALRANGVEPMRARLTREMARESELAELEALGVSLDESCSRTSPPNPVN